MRKNPNRLSGANTGSHSIPYCETCGGSGPGYEFPLFPRCSDKTFGAICAECDHERANEYGLARPGRHSR